MPLEEIFTGLDAVPPTAVTYRTVALLDILGFKRMIENVDLPTLAQRYGAALLGTESLLAEGDDLNEPEETRRRVVCDRYIFSDTIILISTDDSITAADDVIFCAWRTCQFLIAGGLPLRGALAFGEMHADRERQVFLGKALTRAHELEQRQDWIGTAIDQSLADRFPSLFPTNPADFKTGIVPTYDVPMKGGGFESLRTINWRAQFVAENGIRELFPAVGDASSVSKLANTLKYAAAMRARGYDLKRPFLHRLAPFVVTDDPGEREINHGDEF